MKKLFYLTTLLLMLNNFTFASIQNVQETYSFKIDYPVITLENRDAQEDINRYIANKIHDYKKDFNNHSYAEAAVTYDIKYEDNDYLSIAFTYWWYYPHAAHGMYDTTGIVFDKHSGKVVPLKNFIKPISAKQLDSKIRNKEINLYNTIFEPIELTDIWKVERVSQSYYIDKDKNVYLIYQPYELSYYANGNTYIKMPKNLTIK